MIEKQKRLVVVGTVLVLILALGYFYLWDEPIEIVLPERTETWWILPSAVSWRPSGKTIVNWGGGDASHIKLRGHHDILPGSTYRLELNPTGISSEYEVVSIHRIR